MGRCRAEVSRAGLRAGRMGRRILVMKRVGGDRRADGAGSVSQFLAGIVRLHGWWRAAGVVGIRALSWIHIRGWFDGAVWFFGLPDSLLWGLGRVESRQRPWHQRLSDCVLMIFSVSSFSTLTIAADEYDPCRNAYQNDAGPDCDAADRSCAQSRIIGNWGRCNYRWPRRGGLGEQCPS